MSDDYLKKYWQNRQAEVSSAKVMPQSAPQQSPPPPQSQGRTVDLIEGHKYFSQIKSNGFGGVANLAKNAGIIFGQTSKNVILKGERIFYIIPEDQKVFDMGKLNPQTQVVLMEIEVPLVGCYFVSKESIIYKSSGNYGSRQILKG